MAFPQRLYVTVNKPVRLQPLAQGRADVHVAHMKCTRRLHMVCGLQKAPWCAIRSGELLIAR